MIKKEGGCFWMLRDFWRDFLDLVSEFFWKGGVLDMLLHKLRFD